MFPLNLITNVRGIQQLLVPKPIILGHFMRMCKGINECEKPRKYDPCSPDQPPKVGCRRALVDLPEFEGGWRRKPKGILHKIKLKIIEGGTNFGTPFRRLQCALKIKKEKEDVIKVSKETKALPAPCKEVKVDLHLRKIPPGVQVSVLGVDTNVGQYIALLLKQSSCIKKLRLYESVPSEGSTCHRCIDDVVRDLRQIDTNCLVQGFSVSGVDELQQCLQNSDIVLILESMQLAGAIPAETRFKAQAPIVKNYADAIADQCPRAFVIVCTTPIECMVPLVAETLKETGWYDPRRLMGSLAVPEMRASTIAARALCLEPRYTRVPCVGGTEGESLVPLFSKAVEYFEFTKNNALMLTNAVRSAPLALARSECNCAKSSELSEAHALAGLVNKVAYALKCNEIERVTGFVETDSSQVVSPAKYIASELEIAGPGIVHNMGLPLMSPMELTMTNLAISHLDERLALVSDWIEKFRSSTERLNVDNIQYQFFTPGPHKRFDDCAYANM